MSGQRFDSNPNRTERKEKYPPGSLGAISYEMVLSDRETADVIRWAREQISHYNPDDWKYTPPTPYVVQGPAPKFATLTPTTESYLYRNPDGMVLELSRDTGCWTGAAGPDDCVQFETRLYRGTSLEQLPLDHLFQDRLQVRLIDINAEILFKEIEEKRTG